MRGFEAIPALIRSIGSPTVFAVLASTNGPYLANGVDTRAFDLIKTRHEETATAAAMAYSRATGKIGISSVQRGPGLANSINALMVGQSVHAPAVVLVAESPATKDHTAKGNIKQRELIESIGVGFHHASEPAALETRFMEAVGAARWNGLPQVLSIGDGILDAPVELSGMEPAPPEQQFDLDPDSVRAAVDALEKSERPLILAGQGAVHAGCRSELELLASLVGARMANSFYGAGFFSGNEHNLGLCGSWASKAVQPYLAESDVVVAFGASLNRYTTAEGTIFGRAKVIHCEVDSDQPIAASAPEFALLGDARIVASALISEWRSRGLQERPVKGNSPSRVEIQRSVLEVDLGHDPSRGLDLRQVYASLDERLPIDRVVVTDSGRHLSVIPSLVGCSDARSFINSRGYGSVGLGLASAIGAAAGHPGRPIVLFCGDGGFTMASHELDTIRRYGMNVKVFVMNDLMYGAEVRYLREFGLGPDVLEMSFPEVSAVAGAYGGNGVVIRDSAGLASLEVPAEGLFIVDIRVDPDVRGGDALG